MAKAEGKTEVKRIVIQVKDKEIPLTVDEAKERSAQIFVVGAEHIPYHASARTTSRG